MPTCDRALRIIWETAIESAVNAFLILVLGSIAVGIVGGIWQNMAPSRPPGFVAQPEAEATTSGVFSRWGAPLVEHRFWILSGLLFMVTLYFRLFRSDVEEKPGKRSRVDKIWNRLSKQWFGLVVGNAFGAMIAAIVVTAFARFTPAKMLLGWLLSSALVELQGAIRWVFGSGTSDGFQAWLNWYSENQLKFTFWFFYLAGVCDDLGFPNLKTLGRWLKRRYWHPPVHQPLLHNDQPSR